MCPQTTLCCYIAHIITICMDASVHLGPSGAAVAQVETQSRLAGNRKVAGSIPGSS